VRYLVFGLVSLSLLAMAGPAEALVTVSNAFYEAHIADTADGFSTGSWNAITAAGHPTGPGDNILFSGTTVTTNFSSLRVYKPGGPVDYTFGGRGGSVDLDPFVTGEGASPLAPIGHRTTWGVTPEGLDITQDVLVVGGSFSTAAVYHTVEVANTSASPVEIGWRNLYDWQVNDPGFDDGPNNQIELSGGAVLVPATTTEFAYFPPGTDDLVRVSIDPGVPTYEPLQALGFDPGFIPALPITSPEEYDYVSWPGSVGTAFDYTPAGAGVTGDSAGLTYWGRTAGTAVEIAPGGAVRFTTAVFGVAPDAPPPGGIIPEPSTILVWSVLAGLGMACAWRRRRK